MPVDLSDYKEVPERIADFKKLYPTGCLQPADPSRPFWIEQVGERFFVCYAAAAYRTPDDPRPGIGVAWEPFPGRTPYTKDSEAMNAETSAWGRAIVAVLASESKGIASANEVRNRRADQEVDDPPGSEAHVERHSRSVSSGGMDGDSRLATEKQRAMLRAKLKAKGYAVRGSNRELYPAAWGDAGLPLIDESFPFSEVNTALELIDNLESAS